MRITLVHALKHSIAPIEASFARLWPNARRCGCHGHPAFPTPSKGGRFMHDSSALRCEAAKARLVVIASAAEQSILSLRRDGLLRFARNDGAARWIASRSPSSGGHSADPLAGMTPQAKRGSA